MSNLKPPMQYIGGKRRILPQIKELIPNDVNIAIDVFGGAGSFTLATPKIQHHIWNDSNIHIYEIFRAIIEYPKLIIDQLDKLTMQWNETEQENRKFMATDLAVIFNTNYVHFSVKAAIYIFLTKVSFNNLIIWRGNYISLSSLKSKGADLKINWFDFGNILKISEYMKSVELLCWDFRGVLEKYKNWKSALFFLDPPYLDKSKLNYYKDKWDKSQEIILKEYMSKINDAGGYFIYTNYATDEIKEMYKDYRQIIVSKKAMRINQANKTEIIVTNIGGE